MNENNNSGNPSAPAMKSFKLGVKLFTFLNFFLALILISDFFLEPEYKVVEKTADTTDSKFFSLSVGEDSLKINNGNYEIKENEQAAITPIFRIEMYHKYKTSDKEDGYSVDIGTVFLPFVAVLLWLISFIAVIKPREKDKDAEPALMYQLLLLPVIVSLVYWVKLYTYLL